MKKGIHYLISYRKKRAVDEKSKIEKNKQRKILKTRESKRIHGLNFDFDLL